MKKMKKLILALAMILCLNSTAFAASRNVVTKYQHLRNGSSLAAASFEIIPYNEVETGSSILITFSNAKVFSQEVIDGTGTSGKKGYKAGGYQYNNNGVTWDGNESFYSFMPKVNNSQLPYHITRISDDQIQVTLINLPEEYADSSLADINGALRSPYYTIPMVAYADIERGEGEVGVYIDGNGTSISDMGSTVVNNSGAETTTVTEKTTETTTAKTEEKTDSSSVQLDNRVAVQIGSPSIEVNGKTVAIDVPAYIQPESSSSMLPLRAVSQGVVGNEDCVSWNADTKTATITYEGNTVSFTAGSNMAYINGKAVAMQNGVRAEIKESRMFVPFRALGEALGAEVSWNAATKTAYFN